MIFERLFKRLKKRYRQPDKKVWLDKLVGAIEHHRDNDDSLAFRIVELKGTGFLVKVNGLFAFISFHHMPWKYRDLDSWRAVAPYLINKKFYCKIHKIEKDPLAIIVNGEITQFKKVELSAGKEYNGLIISKTDFGLFIDIGCHFDWHCGSVVGYIHKSRIQSSGNTGDYDSGHEIKVIYEGLNDKGQHLFSYDSGLTQWWSLEVPQSLVGEIIQGKVIREPDNNQVDVLIQDIYRTNLAFDRAQLAKYKQKLKQIKKELVNGQIVNCEIVEVNEKDKTLKVKWLAEIDTDLELDNSLKNHLDQETVNNLLKAKNQTNG
jgi:ribosomal protein S1